MTKGTEITIEVSNRHIHLSKEDISRLFGEDYELSVHRELSQSVCFAAEEKLHLIGETGTIENVRVIGPARTHSQVELLNSDLDTLGISAPTRLSGDIKNSAGIKLEGPKGSIVLNEGVIVAKRHIHMSKKESDTLGLVDGDSVSIKLKDSENIIPNLLIRVGDDSSLSAHIDVDESEKFNTRHGDIGHIIADF